MDTHAAMPRDGVTGHQGEVLAEMADVRRSERAQSRNAVRDQVRAERENVRTARAKWYVIQVAAGKERALCEVIERTAAGLVDECFCPAYATQRKVRGEWRDAQAMLFPGYVIAVTRDAAALKDRLRRVSEFTRLLSMGESFTALTNSERAWISAFTEAGERVMPMSVGVVEGDRVRVLKGPLMGNEAWIRRVDRKRSTAYIELKMFGRRIETRIGLAIIRKMA